MAEENSKSTTELPFKEFVRQQFGFFSTRFDSFESSILELRGEMIERFLQLRKQIQRLDRKQDVFIEEQIEMKAEMREIREALKVRN